MRLNDRTVTLSSPALPRDKAEQIIFDEDVPGFGLRLRQAGSRTFIFQYWHGERSRRITLGKFPKLTAQAARTLVEDLSAKVALGFDPAAEKYERRARSETFGELKTAFLAAHASELRPRSLIETQRHLVVHAKPLHDRAIEKIDRRNIADLLLEISQSSGPVAANRVRSSISAMFNWAMKVGRAESNPAASTIKKKETPRDRVLSIEELARIWLALPEGDFGVILKLLILSGQRRNEIGDLRWSEIDTEDKVITLPAERVKNARQHLIPLTAAMRWLLTAVAKRDGREFVFGYGDGGFSGWSRCKRRLDALAPISGWTLHDIRRAVATGMGEIGISPFVIEGVLNHATGHRTGIAAVYNRSQYKKETRSALNKWNIHVLKTIKQARPPRKSGAAA